MANLRYQLSCQYQTTPLYSPTDAAPQLCRNLPPLFNYSIVMKQYVNLSQNIDKQMKI